MMRAFKDLREFLQLLEAEGQLLRIIEAVSLEPDLAAAGRAITQLGETSPAIHFDRINGYQNVRVVLNVHGSWPNLALMLGMAKDGQCVRERRAEFRDGSRWLLLEGCGRGALQYPDSTIPKAMAE